MTAPESVPAVLRRPGGRWRLLVHEYAGRPLGERAGVYGVSHTVRPGPARRPDGIWSVTHQLPGTEFDELAVGRWLHVEQMDTGTWWMNVGGVTVHVRSDRDGRPRRVTVHGPGDYASPVEGCSYELAWSADSGGAQ